MTDALVDLPPHLRRRLERALDTGFVTASCSAGTLRSVLGLRGGGDDLVADGEAVFMTSTNLTDAALDRNIELGVLIRDRAFAASVTSHFRGLIDNELPSPLPAS